MFRAKFASGLRRLLGKPSPAPEAPSAAPAPPPTAPEPQPEHEASSLDRDMVLRVIDRQVRPALRADGGDIELVAIHGADVHVRLQGACRGCPGAGMTLKMGVEALLRDEIPGFGRVIDLG